MRFIDFTKMHGAGNDFVVLDGIRDDLPEMETFSQRIGHRQFGIGCDQILVARQPRDPDAADFRMEIYNRDGSQVEMCGNGIRPFFTFLRGRGDGASGRACPARWGESAPPRRGGGAGGRRPVTLLPQGARVTAAAAGRGATLALLSDQTLWCWGCRCGGKRATLVRWLSRSDEVVALGP